MKSCESSTMTCIWGWMTGMKPAPVSLPFPPCVPPPPGRRKRTYARTALWQERSTKQTFPFGGSRALRKAYYINIMYNRYTRLPPPPKRGGLIPLRRQHKNRCMVTQATNTSRYTARARRCVFSMPAIWATITVSGLTNCPPKATCCSLPAGKKT